jgi:hypothetical protein
MPPGPSTSIPPSKPPRFRRLEDLYQAHKAGGPLGYGPAAERMAKAFEGIQETV